MYWWNFNYEMKGYNLFTSKWKVELQELKANDTL